MGVLELNSIDREYYRQRLAGFLPRRIVDVHTHVWLEQFKAPPDSSYRAVTWPLRVASRQTLQDLQETYRLLFPEQQTIPLMFGFSVAPKDDMDANNAYVADAAREAGYPSLVFASPQWSAEELDRQSELGGFLGAKVYLTLADPNIPEKEVRIFDFLPHHQLEVLNRRGAIVMLHIPRDGRLRDPLNLSQMLEIERSYPEIKLIIAHVGRAYCIEDVGEAFDALAESRRMYFDFSANTNAEVFERLIQAVGPSRILFGSDLPITRMRMRRISENGRYVNLVPKGLYGDVGGDSHMREVDSVEASRLSLFLYEQIDSFRCAAEATGLSHTDVQAVFCDNAVQMIHAAGGPADLFESLQTVNNA